jgi:dTMP kinase
MSRFIVIDGLDGSGKGTQIALLQKRFEHRPVVFTREPGGTPRAERIRQILLRQTSELADPLTDLLLFFAARRDHIRYLIEPMRQAGNHIISDRYDSSTYAFQLSGELNHAHADALFDLFDRLRTLIVRGDGNPYPPGRPDAYIFLDLPAAVAHERCRSLADEKQSVYDVKPLEYHERVRNGFEAFKRQYSSVHTEICFIDADRSIAEVQDELLETIERIFAEDDDNLEE